MRSVRNWLRYYSKEGRRLDPGVSLQERAVALDEAMMEAFDQREDSLMCRLMAEKIWGTEPGLQQFNMGRMEAWQDICQEFLPTSELG